MREEERELKLWLTSLLPEGMSRNDVADTLGVERKTISTMLNPETSSFSRGLTMLRYLQLAGALSEAPESLALSRLESIEAKVDETLAGIGDILDLLREAPPESGARAPEVSPR